MDHLTTDVESEDEDETEILQQAAEVVYDRPDQHGDPEDSFQTIAELWCGYFRGNGIADPNIRPTDVANMMILLKVARNVEGHYNEDNWVDIAGYSENGARVDNP